MQARGNDDHSWLKGSQKAALVEEFQVYLLSSGRDSFLQTYQAAVMEGISADPNLVVLPVGKAYTSSASPLIRKSGDAGSKPISDMQAVIVRSLDHGGMAIFDFSDAGCEIFQTLRYPMTLEQIDSSLSMKLLVSIIQDAREAIKFNIPEHELLANHLCDGTFEELRANARFCMANGKQIFRIKSSETKVACAPLLASEELVVKFGDQNSLELRIADPNAPQRDLPSQSLPAAAASNSSPIEKDDNSQSTLEVLLEDPVDCERLLNPCIIPCGQTYSRATVDNPNCFKLANQRNHAVVCNITDPTTFNKFDQAYPNLAIQAELTYRDALRKQPPGSLFHPPQPDHYYYDGKLIKDPVVTPDGKTHERAVVVAQIRSKEGYWIGPRQVTEEHLIRNLLLQELITRWNKKNPQQAAELQQPAPAVPKK